MSNIQNNMNYRNYLINNADNIIKHNQVVATSTSSNTSILPTFGVDQQVQNPNEVNHYTIPLPYNENDSNLKIDYLNNYLIQANMSAPNIKF